MPAALPYMPVYIGDYLGDTSHLSTLEHGAYLLLLFHYWKQGQPLSNDPERLRLIAGVSRSVWAKMSPKIGEFFFDNGTAWIHKRVEEELKRARAKSKKAQAAGQKSGEARRERMFNGRSTDAQRSLNMSESESESEEEKSPSSSVLAPPRAPARIDDDDDDVLELILGEFERQTGRQRKPADEVAARTLRGVAFESVRRGIAKSVAAVGDGRVSSLRYCVPAIEEAERLRARASVGAAPRPVAVPDPDIDVADELERPASEYSKSDKEPVWAEVKKFLARSASMHGRVPNHGEIRSHLILECGHDPGLVEAMYPTGNGLSASSPGQVFTTAEAVRE